MKYYKFFTIKGYGSHKLNFLKNRPWKYQENIFPLNDDAKRDYENNFIVTPKNYLRNSHFFILYSPRNKLYELDEISKIKFDSLYNQYENFVSLGSWYMRKTNIHTPLSDGRIFKNNGFSFYYIKYYLPHTPEIEMYMKLMK